MWNSDTIRRFVCIRNMANQGRRIDGAELTELYNDVFQARLLPTSCGSCINNRYAELRNSYEILELKLKEEEEKAKALIAIDEFMSEDINEIKDEKNKPRKKGAKKCQKK